MVVVGAIGRGLAAVGIPHRIIIMSQIPGIRHTICAGIGIIGGSNAK